MRPQASPSSAQAVSTRPASPRRSRLRAVLLATSALASAALPATVAHAGNATWSPGGVAPANANFNDGANWSGNGGAAPDGTATFNASGVRNILFTLPTAIGGITLASDAADYTFTSNNVGLFFTGAGLSVGSGASLTLNLASATLSSFSGTSTAGQAHININNHTELDFTQGSSAGSSILTVGDLTTPGILIFKEQADGGTARINLNSGGLSRYFQAHEGGDDGRFDRRQRRRVPRQL
jgi:hypothetical protein